MNQPSDHPTSNQRSTLDWLRNTRASTDDRECEICADKAIAEIERLTRDLRLMTQIRDEIRRERDRLRAAFQEFIDDVREAEGDYGIGLAMTKAEKALAGSPVEPLKWSCTICGGEVDLSNPIPPRNDFHNRQR